MDNPDYQPRSPLEKLSIERFGGRTYIQETRFRVAATRSTLIPNNPNRVFWAVINEQVADCRLSNDPEVTTASGWLLSANGGVISMSWEEDGESVGYEVFIITNVAFDYVRVREVIRL